MFGLGKGKMDIQLAKFNFSPGETIEGKVSLNLKKQVKARGVFVSLIGQKKERQTTSRGTSTSYRKIFDFKQPLDKAGEYQPQSKEYTFKIKVPANILANAGQVPDGAVGNLVKAAKYLSGGASSIRWYLHAKVDIPMGIDVSKKVQINIA